VVIAAVVITDTAFAGEGGHGLVGDAAEGGRGKHEGLQAVERATQVARSHLRDLLEDFFRRLDAKGAEAALLVGESRA
jgi:hypothetical protein